MLRQIPGVQIVTGIGKGGSFEVYVDDQLIYSKLKTGSFPAPQEIVEKVMAMAGGAKGCNIQPVPGQRCCNK